MATPILPPTGEPSEYNSNYILYWNNIALELNRPTVTVGGPYGGPASSARALGMIHLAIHDAYFAINKSAAGTYLDPKSTKPGFRLPPLLALYATDSANIPRTTTNILSRFLQGSVSAFHGPEPVDTLSSSYRLGVAVGNSILNLLSIKPGEPGFDQDSYRPTPGPNGVQPGLYRFGDDPTNPVRIVPVDVNNPDGPRKGIRVYDAPFYGMSAKRLAVQHRINGDPTEHIIADPPVGFGVNDVATYGIAVDEVYRQGGDPTLSSTRRSPNQTVTGYFWAYDGANLQGTPPRVYNQIVRKVAWNMRPDKHTTMGPRGDRPGQLFPIGGVPLGIGIANDIFQGGLKPTPPVRQPTGRSKCGDFDVTFRTQQEANQRSELSVQNPGKQWP